LWGRGWGRAVGAALGDGEVWAEERGWGAAESGVEGAAVEVLGFGDTGADKGKDEGGRWGHCEGCGSVRIIAR